MLIVHITLRADDRQAALIWCTNNKRAKLVIGVREYVIVSSEVVINDAIKRLARAVQIQDRSVFC